MGTTGSSSNRIASARRSSSNRLSLSGSPRASGWARTVTNVPPTGVRFDVGFSAFVLNVVPEWMEKDIIEEVASMCDVSYHITRNLDIFDAVQKQFYAEKKSVNFEKFIWPWFTEHFATRREIKLAEQGALSPDIILEFCQSGLATGNNQWQRIPTAEDYGVGLGKVTKGYKVYKHGDSP